MKIAVVLVACLGLALGASVPPPTSTQVESTLLYDIQDFFDLLPAEEFPRTMMLYVENDVQLQGAIIWVQSNDFRNLIIQINRIPAYIDFLNYLYSHGIDTYGVVNSINWALELEPLVPPKSTANRVARSFFVSLRGRRSGIKRLINELRALIPTEEVKELWRYKVASSPNFKGFVHMMESKEFLSIINALQTDPQFKDVLKQLEARGIDLQQIVLLLQEILGWGG